MREEEEIGFSIFMAENLLKKAEGPKELCNHPESGEPIFLKEGRFGPYIQCGDKMKSLLPGMKIEEITPDIAQAIISLPKELGKHPDSDDIIKVDTGRYGPYIRCGKTTRSVNAPDNISTALSRPRSRMFSVALTLRVVFPQRM